MKWQTRYLAQDILADVVNSGHKVERSVFIEACAFYSGDDKVLLPLGVARGLSQN